MIDIRVCIIAMCLSPIFWLGVIVLIGMGKMLKKAQVYNKHSLWAVLFFIEILSIIIAADSFSDDLSKYKNDAALQALAPIAGRILTILFTIMLIITIYKKIKTRNNNIK